MVLNRFLISLSIIIESLFTPLILLNYITYKRHEVVLWTCAVNQCVFFCTEPGRPIKIQFLFKITACQLMSWESAVMWCPVHTLTSSSICGQYWIGVMALAVIALTQHHVQHVTVEEGVGWFSCSKVKRSDLCWAAAGPSCTSTRRGKPAAGQTRWKSSASAHTGRPCRAASSAP